MKLTLNEQLLRLERNSYYGVYGKILKENQKIQDNLNFITKQIKIYHDVTDDKVYCAIKNIIYTSKLSIVDITVDDVLKSLKLV